MQTNFIPEDPLSVTASFGVATSPAGGSFDDAFQQADQALYLAKSRGRNCVWRRRRADAQGHGRAQRHLGADQRALQAAQVAAAPVFNARFRNPITVARHISGEDS
jgi:predicted signal transduction protein with EAL and GGDEF domain